MHRASSLSGDTLIACHFPLVQLSPWQLPVQALCSSAKRPGRLSSAGLTRAASLPEQDCLRREAVSHGGLRHTSSTYCSLKERGEEEEGEEEEEEEEEGEEGGGSDSSARCDSASSPEEAAPRLANARRKKERPAARGAPRSHNSFLPNVEVEEHEEDEDSDGDNLHRYREDSSFVLHGNSNWATGNAAGFTSKPTRSHDRPDSPCRTRLVHEGALYRQQHESNTVLMDCECEEQEWGGKREDSAEDDMPKGNGEARGFGCDQPECFPESSSDGHPEDASDSSCNSSDGVLVNFSAIYDRSNNPATPNDLGSPAAPLASEPAEGSVFLNLQPLGGDKTGCSPQDVAVPSAPRWSPQALDSNCNLYPPNPAGPRDPQAQGLSSLEVSDLTACLQSQASLATGTIQKYYKLVTCDLSSQSSHSPAWSSLTSSSPAEGPSRASPEPPAEYFLFTKAREKEQQKASRRKSTPVPSGCGFHRPCCGSWVSQRDVNSFAEMVHCQSQCSGRSQTSQDLCPIQEAVPLGQSNRQDPLAPSPSQGSSTVTTHPSAVIIPALERCDTEAELAGPCSWETPVVRYTKAQRPTSLPIRPFVLLSSPGKPQSQPLGSLLDQYVGHKNARPAYAQPASKRKGKGNRLLTRLRPSPLGSHGGPILLEAPSSSDTCSTCTPSPERLRPGWARGGTGQGQTRVSPNRPYRSPSPGLILHSPKSSRAEVARAHAGIDHTSPDLGATQIDLLTKTYTGPEQTQHSPAQTQPSPGRVRICYDLIRLSPVQTQMVASGPTRPSPPLTHSPRCPASSHTPPGLLVSLLPTLPPHRPPPPPSPPPTGVADPVSSLYSLTAAFSSLAPLSSLTSLLSLAGSGLPPQEAARHAGRQQQPGDSFTLSDRPPVEFSLSPEASYESLSISHLQRRGLLKSVSLAVDLIMAHFGTSRDPEEKVRLGNSSRSPTIGGLVLEHLCPTIQNILHDGLRDHKLDLIIGQLPNHSWSVVEVATQTGPSTRVLHSLVNKVRQCPLLTSHGVRLRAFIMGLLNLRALEFWLSHLHSQKDVVTAHYHPWGFLPMSQGRCRPLFQELLLLLQPLSVLPFELNLLTEPRLLQIGQLCCEEQGVPPPPPRSTFLMTRWPPLRADTRPGAPASGEGPGDERGQHLRGSSQGERRERPAGGSGRSVSSSSAPSPGRRRRRPAHVEEVVEAGDCSRNHRHCGARGRTADPQDESLTQGGLRWAKLFGSGVEPSPGTQRGSQSFNGTRTKRRPSQWLQLDGSQLGLLAQSVWPGKWAGPGPGPGIHPDQHHP